MSLLVHLPLIGDLRNNGLAGDVAVTNYGATVNNSGKLGQCYEFDGSDDYIEVNDIDIQTVLQNDFSIAMWIYNNDSGDRSILFGTYAIGSNVNIEKTVAEYTRFYFNGAPDITISQASLTPTTWVHLAVVKTASKVEFYINGALVFTYTGIINSSAPAAGSKFYIGRDYRTGATAFKGLINDFRLYDNAISPKEVKELSKGLVAHWKLDDPYVEETTNLVTSSTTGYGQITRVGDTLVTSGENKDTYFRLSLGAALVAGTTYTASMYCRGMADGGTATFGVGAQSGDNRAALWTVQNGHNECTFIVPTGLNGATSIMFDDLNRMGLIDHQAVFSQIQVEQKDHATGYIAWGTSRAKGAVYDSSGYCHDGTLSPTPPTFDSDSARYSGCMKFSSNYIHCGLSSLYPTDEITVAWWGYMDSWGSSRPISCTETGGWNFEQGDGGGWRFPVYKNGIGYVYSVPAKKWADYTSGWHFFVGTFDGYVSRIYVDGELDSTSTNASPTVKAAIMYRANVPIYIGCEANGANPSSPYFNGKLSDIRIYATALSAEDIKELYNTSASIDNHHNVYARELVED